MWMVARTELRREATAQYHLERSGLKTYLPRFKEWRTKRVQPLFPNYIFVHNTTGLWWFIRTTIGVSKLLMRGTGPDTLPAKYIDDLRAKESDGLVQLRQLELQRGQRVCIVGSALNGVHAIFDGMTGKERCRILFEMLGQQVTATVDACYVREYAGP